MGPFGTVAYGPFYPVAPHLAEVLEPALTALDGLHKREIGLTPGISRPA